MSGSGVLEALRSRGVDAHAFDPAERDLVELKREGFARCFIALHGRHGEDGTVQGALELLGIPYTGSGVMASSVAMDKVMTKRVWHGRRPADAAATCCLRLRPAEPRADHRAVPDVLGLPLIVKPPREGSSIGVTKVDGLLADAGRGGAGGASYDADVLCEEFIERRGSDLPRAGHGARRARAAGDPHRRARGRLRLPEQVLHRRREVPRARAACPKREEHEIQRIALAAYRTLGCRGWGRADVMIRASDRKPFLLEMNTSPGMTSHSLVPMSARAAGIALRRPVPAGAGLGRARFGTARLCKPWPTASPLPFDVKLMNIAATLPVRGGRRSCCWRRVRGGCCASPSSPSAASRCDGEVTHNNAVTLRANVAPQLDGQLLHRRPGAHAQRLRVGAVGAPARWCGASSRTSCARR